MKTIAFLLQEEGPPLRQKEDGPLLEEELIIHFDHL